MTSKRWPDFLIIGAAKAGTTSLAQYLGQHPSLFMAREKESHFFTFDGQRPQFRGPGDDQTFNSLVISDERRYLKCFEEAPSGSVAGEASVFYLYVPASIERALKANPEMRLVAVLRNPSERARSAHDHMVRDGWEQLDLAAAFTQEDTRKANGWSFGWHYRSVSQYVEQVRAILEIAPRANLHFLTFEHFRDDPAGELSKLFTFLGVASDLDVDTTVAFNQSGLPRFRALNQLITQPNALKTAAKAVLPYRWGKRVSHKILSWNLDRSGLGESSGVASGAAAFDGKQLSELTQMTGLDLSVWPASG